MGRQLDFSYDTAKQRQFQELDFDRMHRECCDTEAACLRLDSPVVFNHNDMLAGNVLVPHNVRPLHAPALFCCSPQRNSTLRQLAAAVSRTRPKLRLHGHLRAMPLTVHLPAMTWSRHAHGSPHAAFLSLMPGVTPCAQMLVNACAAAYPSACCHGHRRIRHGSRTRAIACQMSQQTRCSS